MADKSNSQSINSNFKHSGIREELSEILGVVKELQKINGKSKMTIEAEVKGTKELQEFKKAADDLKNIKNIPKDILNTDIIKGRVEDLTHDLESLTDKLFNQDGTESGKHL